MQTFTKMEKYLSYKNVFKHYIFFVQIKNPNMTSNSLYESNRNLRSQARDSLISFVNMISISDMDSLRTQAGMLSILTSQTDEITRSSEVQLQKET
jgi:hypothetical protein